MLKNYVLACVLVAFGACGGPSEPGAPPSSPTTTDFPEAAFPSGVQTGVALDLAIYRKASLSDIHYALYFTVPDEASEDQSITAEETLTFTLDRVAGDLQLDFREQAGHLTALRVNGETAAIRHEAEHLILAANLLRAGENVVEVSFIAGDTSLNRNPGYLYTLFVPDRARTAFPLFDQPNLKATYDLRLELPASWVALGNGRKTEAVTLDGGRRLHTFATTDKLSSYLFSFVAGEFQTVTRTLNGREMTMLHRETDEAKLARNVDDIFQAHADALAWLEDYTGIAYPFQKFDFALIPTFQYGGMEHVGAIQYRASTLLLVEDPSDPQKLARANLIAHETAHMWFGNLVTMDWFNDVWTKEVFANFMAAKIVNPSFPDIDHDLNFLLRSYPAAYAVDRTEGANPIRQDLPNLNEAGTLYGGIIYNKAPIMMRQLEYLIGEDAFQEGMREYLSTYAGRNATWPDLIAILDTKSQTDLKAWSEVWVNTPGRPHYTISPDGARLVQGDPLGQDRIWQQAFDAAVITQNAGRTITQSLTHDELLAGALSSVETTDLRSDVVVNSTGFGYGVFPVNLAHVDRAWGGLADLQKGAQLINLYEQMLEGHEGVAPIAYYAFLSERLEEPNELVLNTLLGQLRRVYWSFLSDSERLSANIKLDPLLWSLVADETKPISTRRLYLTTLQNIASEVGIGERLQGLLDSPTPLIQSSRARGALVAELAIAAPDEAERLVREHLATLDNPDEKRRFEFIAPVLSADEAERDAFFERLQSEEHRAIESWVVDALAYLHHPRRVRSSERYLQQSLELMEEIQVTGDIFFPARWINGTLGNHKSPDAAQIVRAFLAARPNYNYQLKLKILQGADMLFRASEHSGGGVP